MVRFWDTSALVPLLVSEPGSDEAEDLATEDPDIYVWWGTEVECMAAIARNERAGARSQSIASMVQDLQLLASRWFELEPTPNVRETAKRLVRAYPLRAADAMQLAAATILADGDPSSVEIVTLDDRLRDAATREGFAVLPKRRR